MQIAEDHVVNAQVERILQSEEFRNSETLRKLLRYLSEKTLAGNGETLKEYLIAVECLDKSPSYDPKQSAAVRIQIGRLRMKMASYYRTEGSEDDLVVDIPKGHFNVVATKRAVSLATTLEPTPISIPGTAEYVGTLSQTVKRTITTRAVPVSYVIALCVVFAIIMAAILFRPAQPQRAVASNPWTPELEEIWEPIVTSNQPLLLTVGNPLFVEFSSNKGIYYRDRGLEDWDSVQSSPNVRHLRDTLGDPPMAPSRYYTAYGSAFASFLLAKKLSPHVSKFTLYPISELPWSQLADNNVLFVGVQNLFFEKQLAAMPIKPSLVQEPEGIRDLAPTAGAPAFYADDFKKAPTEAGTVYGLVTHVPGPQSRTDIESFASNRSAGYIAAVQAFTNASMAKALLAELKRAGGGKMPRYYQVLFRVTFENGTATETTTLLVRPLR